MFMSRSEVLIWLSLVLLQIKPTVVLTPPRVDLSSQSQDQYLAQEDGTFSLPWGFLTLSNASKC